jgi:hypothetical protein
MTSMCMSEAFCDAQHGQWDLLYFSVCLFLYVYVSFSFLFNLIPNFTFILFIYFEPLESNEPFKERVRSTPHVDMCTLMGSLPPHPPKVA